MLSLLYDAEHHLNVFSCYACCPENFGHSNRSSTASPWSRLFSLFTYCDEIKNYHMVKSLWEKSSGETQQKRFSYLQAIVFNCSPQRRRHCNSNLCTNRNSTLTPRLPGYSCCHVKVKVPVITTARQYTFCLTYSYALTWKISVLNNKWH